MESHVEAVMSECVNGVHERGQEPGRVSVWLLSTFLQVRVVVMVRIFV